MKAKTKKRKRYTYTVPVVHHLTFGLEVEVTAPNLKEARRLALDPNADCAEGDGYDWNRQDFERARLGNWQKITREEA